MVAKPLAHAGKRSAAPEAVAVALERLAEDRPDEIERLVAGSDTTPLGRRLVAVVAASRSLGRLCLAEPAALDVLDALEKPVTIDASSAEALVRSKHLELLRIAARDLLGMVQLEEVGADLAALADSVLEGTVTLVEGGPDGLAVIGMGKLGGQELNYASDVDVLFVAAEASGNERARRVLGIARRCFRVDANLRPDGRSGPLTRSVAGYRAYWQRRAATWELQALIKARPVAGDGTLGRHFAETAARELWGHVYGADELAEVRRMKARAEEMVARRGLATSEIKRGPGGIRDVEFAVQLLQLVHGRHDPQIRDPSTLGALSELSEAGYVGGEDAAVFADAYRFLRAVEHRLQLVEEEQTHQVPTELAARQHLARVLGFRDDPSSAAAEKFDQALRSCQRDVRAVHQRLFFRPLLETFAALDLQGRGGRAGEEVVPDEDGTVMDPAAVAERLAAFGFTDQSRTRAAVSELAGGLTRSSRLMVQLLPLLLDWLSLTPDPDLGLLGLRNLVVQAHPRARMVETFRESPEAARRLCLLLGSSRALAEYITHNPELIGSLGNESALVPTPRDSLVAEAQTRIRQRSNNARRRAQLISLRQDQLVKIAARDLLDIDDVPVTGAALSSLAEALLEAALSATCAQVPFCVIGMGRFGGAELSYASDLDVLFVHDAGGADPADETAAARGETIAESLLHFVHGPNPAQRVAVLDLGLRPEGKHGRLARDLRGYATYFARWAQTWERQALLRARVVAGDRALGERFLAMAASFVWDRALTKTDVADIRRMKARIERERIPVNEDPQFHLKLGRGSLSDVEWTVQLLQLFHGIPGPSTMATLEHLVERGALEAADAEALSDSYRFCERTRNRWYLVGALPGGQSPGDALPTQAHQLSRLARSLGTTPTALRDEYRRVTRRARRVVERLFYGIDLWG
ncbi:MAG: bifunctional [glutamine synthetase] adenylyltransferase/[glutamine synthetase]-adenylyl-L-tyrosine phosphorylase [Acidimicrobiales bacterium]